ncbi:MAG: Na+/H+ antiporter subunit G [Rhodobacterales bacterium]|nr:MAG: Na+/H+ antiporter subunit G [Rhodobacterales bacterium]
MAAVLEPIGALVLLAGAAFLFLGGLGLYRMPDVYTRIQSGTKATTLGTLLLLLGAAIMVPGWTVKLLLIMLFLMFTNPLSSQVLARAAHRAGVPSCRETTRDRLAEDGGDLS